MIIVNPEVKLLPFKGDIVNFVCRCARVCYNKETGNNDERLYNDLIQKKHWSVFRHVTYYAMVTHSSWDIPYFIPDLYRSKQKIVGIDIKEDKGCYYIVYNGNWALDYPTYHKKLSMYHVSPEHFANTEVGYSMMRYSFAITTQISTSRELNRVSPNSITEMSSRYVDLKNGAVCRPYWMTEVELYNWNRSNTQYLSERCAFYCNSCDIAFNEYNALISKYGMKREDARGVLPLDTATKVIYTYSWPEWKHIIELRSDRRSHPNAQIIANLIKKELEDLGYDFS